jgi:hypothetical protein
MQSSTVPERKPGQSSPGIAAWWSPILAPCQRDNNRHGSVVNRLLTARPSPAQRNSFRPALLPEIFWRLRLEGLRDRSRQWERLDKWQVKHERVLEPGDAVPWLEPLRNTDHWQAHGRTPIQVLGQLQARGDAHDAMRLRSGDR